MFLDLSETNLLNLDIFFGVLGVCLLYLSIVRVIATKYVNGDFFDVTKDSKKKLRTESMQTTNILTITVNQKMIKLKLVQMKIWG